MKKSLTEKQVLSRQQHQRQSLSAFNTIANKVRQNLEHVYPKRLAQACSDELLFLYEFVRYFQGDDEKILSLLEKSTSTERIKNALFAIFKTGLNFICEYDWLFPMKESVNSIGESSNQQMFRRLNVFVQAIVEAYAEKYEKTNNHSLKNTLFTIDMTMNKKEIEEILEYNCMLLQTVLQRFGPFGITLNGSCLEKPYST